MKKLMITMSAAAMFSLGANADALLGGMDFEKYDKGDPIAAAADPKGDTSIVFWGSAGGESTVEVEEDEEGEVVNKYLKVDTTDVLVRKTAPVTATDTAAPVAIPEGGDITVSSKVQFTAADEAPTVKLNDGDKLVVWAKAPADGDEDQKIYLHVTALNEDGDGVADYPTEYEVTAEKWYDLAIVSRESDGNAPMEFDVKIKVSTAEKFTTVGTYESLVLTGDYKATIESIGFKGTGAVDDIAFASNEAEVVDTFKFGVTVTDTYDEEAGELPGFASASYSVDGAAAVEIPGTGLSNVAVPCTAKSVVVTVVAYADSKVTTTGAVKGDATTVEGDAAYFWTITKSVEGTTKDASVSISITIEKDGEPTPTDDPEIVVPEGKEIADVIAAATSETGIALANVTSEDQVVIDNAEHTIKVGKAEAVTIADFYTAALASDMKSITLTLNAKALDTAGDMVEVAVDQAFGLKVSASNAKLYYGLASSDTVTGEYAAPTTLMQGNGSALTLAAPKKEGAAGFYKLYVTDIAPVK